MRPVRRTDLPLRVRGVLQRVVVRGPCAVLDLPNLFANGDHGVAEAVKLGLILRLCRFDHEGVRHRPGHRRRVEAVVLQALCDVFLHDARLPADVGEVHDELVGATVAGVGGADGEVGRQARLHVVGVENGVASRVGDPPSAEHRAEHPGDASDARLTPRRGADGPQVAARRRPHDAVARKVRREMLPHADGAEARAAAAVRDAEGLVEVQVADVRTDSAGGGEAELGVHVGAVHVHLSTVVVDDLADLLDVVLEEGARRGVGNHERRQAVLVSLAERAELAHVHAPGVVDPLDFHVAHRGRGRVRAMGRPRDDADVALALADALQVLSDDEKAGVLASGAARGLQRASVEARAANEVPLQRLEKLAIAGGLALGSEGVHVGDLRPAARRQGRDGVKLHRARAEGDHRLVQAEVLQLQGVHVPHHLRLGVDAVEDVLLQKRRRAHEGIGQGPRHGDARRSSGLAGPGASCLDGGHEGHHVLLAVRLVEAGGHMLAVGEHAEIHPLRLKLGDDVLRARGGHVERDRVEEVVRAEHLAPDLAHLPREQLRQGVHLPGDVLQAVGPVVHGVHRRHVGQQYLRSADVGCGLVQANVLLPRLQCEPVGGVAQAVQGLADDTTRHPPHLLFARGEVCRRRAAEPHGHAEALHGAHDAIGAELGRRLRRHKSQRVGGDDEVRAVAVEGVGEA
mmetsp:Transcript_74236/g.215090  ORF Transcript_74236/g.215090 Transcript_74236/m.215090 type:complete len:685 (-) Transcript_74236:933-2987(-)